MALRQQPPQVKVQPKVAVLLIGNMRSYNITRSNLDTHLQRFYDCDLYITTYNKRFNFKSTPTAQDEDITEEKIREVYGSCVKHITIVNQDSFVEPYVRIPGKHYVCNDALDRLYTIQKLAMLAYDVFRGECTRNNRCYDMIIKMRPDIYLREKLLLNFSIKDNQIIVPANDSGGGFNDHMAYGKGRVMLKYFTYYRCFHDIDRLDGDNSCDVSLIESGLRKNLVVANIEITREPIKYDILRDVKPQRVIITGKGQYYVKKYCETKK